MKSKVYIVTFTARLFSLYMQSNTHYAKYEKLIFEISFQSPFLTG